MRLIGLAVALALSLVLAPFAARRSRWKSIASESWIRARPRRRGPAWPFSCCRTPRPTAR